MLCPHYTHCYCISWKTDALMQDDGGQLQHALVGVLAALAFDHAYNFVVF